MEAIDVKLDIVSKELSRELLVEGSTLKVECKNYWDSHGTRFDQAITQHKFDSEKKFEIWKVVRETFYPSINFSHQVEWWELYIEGKPLNVGEITSYKVLKTKLKLDCCVGAG